jgi:vitamin B12 transporter
VDEWIQWVPQLDGNYRPKNIKQVLAEGAEVKVTKKEQMRDLIISYAVSYQFTKSVTKQAPDNQQNTIGKQLIYTPQHTATAFAQLIWRTFVVDFSAQYNGVRFTTSDNSAAYELPSFALINALIGKSWQIDNHSIDFSFSVKNVLNIDYQMYAGRAMPGRNYNFQVSYRLKAKSNK